MTRRSNVNYKKRLIKAQENKCFYCGHTFGSTVIVNERQVNLVPHLEHVEPFAYCHNESKGNLVVACQVCNLFKSDKMFDSVDSIREFLKSKGVHLVTEKMFKAEAKYSDTELTTTYETDDRDELIKFVKFQIEIDALLEFRIIKRK